MDITVLNTALNKIGIIDIAESMIWTDRYLSCGDFELYTEVTLPYITLLQENYYLQIKESDRTMIVESVEIKTTSEKRNKLVVRGRSLESILDRRLIFSQTIIDTTLHAGIKRILNENVINCVSQPQRNIPNFVFLDSTDPLVLAPTLKAQYYGEEVYSTIKYLCEAEGIGFKVQLNASNQFEFSLFAGKDRSYLQSTNSYVVFSPEFDNLVDSDYFHTNVFNKTIALIAGDAYNGTPRKVYDFDPWENDPTDPHYPTIRTGLDRREVYIDAPDLSSIDPVTSLPFDFWTYVYIMYERARQGLADYVPFDTFKGQANTTTSFKYGIDFGLGDIVQIENEYGMKGRSKVTEVIISENLSGRTIFPTFETV